MRGFRAIPIVLIATLVSAGPVAAENVLRWASVGGALTFDPHSYDDIATNAQIRAVYERLTDLDSDLDLVPQLATAWRLVDGTTWDFDLRRNVRFHDGTLFTAADVVFSIARARTEVPVGYAVSVETIVDVRPVGGHTIRLVTAFPDPDIPVKMQIGIMSKRWAEAHDVQTPVNVSAGEENYASRHANGTGPFVLVAFEPNGPVMMVRNNEWWGLERYPHNIDRIEYTPLPDPEERLSALFRGDLDLLTDPPFASLDRVEDAPGLKLTQATEPNIIYLGLDQSRTELRSSDVKGRNPFSDKRVRQAIYQAIDIEAIRTDVMKGLSIPAGMMLPPGANGHAPDLDERLPYDPESARVLLAAAGYPDGFNVTLDCPNNRYISDDAICRAVAAQLKAVAINVTVNAEPKSRLFARLDNRESDFYLVGWGVGTLDSYEIFRSHYVSQGIVNNPGYSNPEVDELTETIGRTMIKYGRDALIEKVWKIVLDDIVYIPLHSQIIVWVMRDNLDLPVYPFNRPIFREARFR